MNDNLDINFLNTIVYNLKAIKIEYFQWNFKINNLTGFEIKYLNQIPHRLIQFCSKSNI